jgi:hypothetical protein
MQAKYPYTTYIQIGTFAPANRPRETDTNPIIYDAYERLSKADIYI